MPAGRVDVDVQMQPRMLLGEPVECLAEPLIAVGGFGEVEGLGGGSLFLIEERDVMCVARGIDADSEPQG